MSTIRVLHMLHSMNRGGAETMIMNYYRNIDRDKVQFDFLLTFDGKSDFEDEILSLGGKIYHLPAFSLRNMRRYCKALEVFLKEHPEYKIVHSHNSSKSVFPLRVAKKCGVPVLISHAHNMELNSSMFSVKEILRKWLRGPLKRVSMYNFACSKETAIWQYGEDYWNTGKVRVLPNAINLEDYSFDEGIRKEYRAKYDLEESIVIGHVGRFVQVKNHPFVLRIFKEILAREPKAKLVLVGDGETRKAIEELARELGIEDKVVFLGTRNDVPNCMQMMDGFIFPSYYEGLGIVLIEAQATGLPCVASKDVIPMEAKVVENFLFISLEDGEDKWAEQILNMCRANNRENRIEEVRKAGYDIKESSATLQNFYIEKT